MESAVTLTGPFIELARMKTLIAGMKLEKMGMRKKGPSCYAIAKHDYDLKGNLESVYTQLCELYEKEKGRLGVNE